MNLTKHAEKRKNQRGISDTDINILLEHGRYMSAPGGAEKIRFGGKECQLAISELKKMIQMLDKAKGLTVIINENKIITVYKNWRPVKCKLF